MIALDGRIHAYPDDVVGQTNNLIACSFGHLRKPFGFCLILKCIGGKVDA